MVQNYTSDCFAAANVAQTDLQNMENNFNTLRSNFSGTAQPSNPVAGGHWMDTTGGTLKVRNSSNSAWSTVFDVDNEYALKLNRQVIAGAGLSGGGTLTSNVTISHAAHDGDVSGTSTLTIGNNTVGANRLNRNAAFVAVFSTARDYDNNAWSEEWGQFPIYIPSKKGFLRILGAGKRSAGAQWLLRLRVGSKYSSGSGTQLNTTYVYKDCGSVSLSSFTSGSMVEIAPQMYAGGGGANIGYVKSVAIAWGSST